MRSNINSYLEEYVRRGRETAYVHRRGLRAARWSYARVARVAYGFARELEARGVGRGERVLLWAGNGPEWAAAFWGCVARGAVVVPLDVESAPDFVARVGAQTAARLLLLSAETRACGAGVGLPSLALEDLEEVASRHPGELYAPEGLGEQDLVEIIYTSGTTAEPRGVCLTHGNLLANLVPFEKEVGKYLKWERLAHPLRFMSLLPLSHVFGQFMGIFVPQLLGGEVYFQDSLNPSEVVEAVRKNRVSVVAAVPRMLESLREHVERREAAAGRAEKFKREIEEAKGAGPLGRLWKFRRVHRRFGWKFWAFVSGGATLAEETETFWRRLGFAVLQGYGMTETASLVTVNHPFKSGRGSVGKILPGHEVRLDEHGEILVRGANVSPGYWDGRGARPLSGEEGWLRTGDLGEMDADGKIYFKGRKKDVIVTAAGLNVYPEDIEAALQRQPEVKAAAVVGVEGARGPEPLAVLIMRDPSADPSAAVERANESLARHQRVLRWRVWPDTDFPRTPTQKVRKRDILERVSGGDGSAETSEPAAAGAPFELSIPGSRRPTPGALSGLDPSAKLATDLKLDSLGRVELLSALEDRYQIEIDDASFTAATTVADIERIVRGAGAESEAASRYPYPEWTQSRPATLFRVAFYYAVVLPITSVLCWVRVRGKAQLKDLRGPALFVSNHITYFDHALILSALPHRLRRRFAIAQEGERLRWWRRPPEGTPPLRRWRWKLQYFLVVLIFNTFSLPQKSGFRRSFAYAGESVDRGFNVLVFPEGTRTEHGRLNPFRAGTGLLASKLRIPVVPVRIDGLYELKRSGRRGFTMPGNVTVTFGRPVTYDPAADPAHIAADLERRVREL
ncbi:MAG TPA: AMP-binding protein [Pyrinomonadaceae bacterium]|nr:AMP-binding protein [Pyrinomonadaceae bacterium]